jgi:hypothetical protein
MMFCGLPTTVATEPTLAAVASATRNGTGGSDAAAASSTTSGVIASTMVSLRKTAESSPDAATTRASSWRGVRAEAATRCATSPKNPPSRRLALSTIIPSSSASVPRSTAANAAGSVSTRSPTRSVAPTSAIVARFMRSQG